MADGDSAKAIASGERSATEVADDLRSPSACTSVFGLDEMEPLEHSGSETGTEGRKSPVR